MSTRHSRGVYLVTGAAAMAVLFGPGQPSNPETHKPKPEVATISGCDLGMAAKALERHIVRRDLFAAEHLVPSPTRLNNAPGTSYYAAAFDERSGTSAFSVGAIVLRCKGEEVGYAGVWQLSQAPRGQGDAIYIIPAEAASRSVIGDDGTVARGPSDTTTEISTMSFAATPYDLAHYAVGFTSVSQKQGFGVGVMP